MRDLPDEVLFDVRLVDRHIRQGLTTREAYEKYLDKLDDAETLGEQLPVEELE